MIRWYFDFISPYAYLHSTRLQRLAENYEVECVPVLFAGLLDHWQNTGPAEVAPKRDWTFRRVAWLAHRDGIPLTLPACHPFNPLPLLRLSIALNNDISSIGRLFRFVWAEGNLPQGNAFAELLDELGIAEETLQTKAVKDTLRANGHQAADRGVFGVPTMEVGDELFWGDDATDMALDFLQQNNWPAEAMSAARNLPSGVNRRSRDQAAGWEKTSDGDTRLPLLPLDLNDPADLVATIRQRRGGELIELDRLLLYSTPLAEGWNALLGNVRSKFTIAQQYRELAMCTVAIVNGAHYEFAQHAPLYIRNGGDEQRANALKDLKSIANCIDIFSQREQLTIALAEQMTRDIQVTDALFGTCRDVFTDTELVELIATIAAYNMVSRFLVALNLH